MSPSEIQIVSGEPYDPERPAILVLRVDSSSTDNSIEVFLGLSLIRHAVPWGWFVKSEVYVACTGASLQIWAKKDDFKINDFTPPGLIKVTFKRTSTARKGIQLNPKLKGKGGGAKVEAEIGEFALSREIQNEAGLEMYEAPLNAIQPSDQVVRWQIDPPRVESIVRDFLEGRADFKVAGTWKNDEPFIIKISARPRDRRVYGPGLRQLGLLWSLGVLAKLRRQGELPPMGEVEMQIPVRSKR
jgi:hypothetical protein